MVGFGTANHDPVPIGLLGQIGDGKRHQPDNAPEWRWDQRAPILIETKDAFKSEAIYLLPEWNRKMLTGRSAYPPTKRWRELTRPEQRERMELSADLLILLQWHRGDPRLTSWEEAFLTGMVRHIETFHGAAKISGNGPFGPLFHLVEIISFVGTGAPAEFNRPLGTPGSIRVVIPRSFPA